MSALISRRRRHFLNGALIIGLIAAMLFGGFILDPAHAATPKQKTFSSPEEGVKALADAVRTNNLESLLAIFGPAGKRIIFSGDEVADRARRERFSKLYDEKNRLETVNDNKMVLHVGNSDWPFPIPLVKVDQTWYFDTKEGKQEILARRIGRNELSAIQVCLAYVDAQREYARKDDASKGLLEYARRFRSTPGKKDGLYWEVKEGQEQSPLGPLLAVAANEGYSGKAIGKRVPYHGYFYKILKGQGPHAPGGAYDYMVNGKMIGGFALVAYPAQYRSSGIMTFIVNQDGVVYQKNLGRKTEQIVREMKKFDPDDTWKKVD
jgi:hypothetical protein